VPSYVDDMCLNIQKFDLFVSAVILRLSYNASQLMLFREIIACLF